MRMTSIEREALLQRLQTLVKSSDAHEVRKLREHFHRQLAIPKSPLGDRQADEWALVCMTRRIAELEAASRPVETLDAQAQAERLAKAHGVSTKIAQKYLAR